MVWGAFSGSLGRAGLYILPKNETMRAQIYTKVLEDHLHSFWDIHWSDVFVHKGAPAQKTKVLIKFFDDYKIVFLECPAIPTMSI